MLVDTQPLVNFFAREGYWRHLQKTCAEALTRRGNDPVLLFWKAFGAMQEGNTSEAIRDLDALRGKRDVMVAVPAALVHAHEACKLVDHEALATAKAQLESENGQANEKACFQAALFFWHVGQHDKARDFLSRAVDKDPSTPGAVTLRGWIDLTCGRETVVAKSLQHFDTALSDSSQRKDVEALLGKAKYFEMKQQFAQALDQLNQVIVLFSWFLPALTEKAKVLLMMGDWDQALETAQRVITQDSHNIEALRIIVLYLLARESRYSIAANRIGDMIQAIDRNEPKNPQLYYNCSRPLCRLAGRNHSVLQQTLTLVDRARTLNPDNSHYFTELGYQQTLLGDLQGAMGSYRQAIKLDESNVVALNGIIKCQLIEGHLDDAEQQLEFLQEIQVSIGRTAELTFLSALLAWKRKQDMNAAIALLDETYDLHVKDTRNEPYTHNFFVKFNTDFLIELAKEYLQHVGSEPIDPADPPSSVILKATKLLETITKHAPGLLEGHFQLARIKYVVNDLEVAQRTLQQCLKLDPTYADAHLLMAQIHLSQDKFKGASQSLELALSHSFQVRDSPMYHLINSKVQEKMGNLAEAVRILEAAMMLPGVKSVMTPAQRRKRGSVEISTNDRVSIFLQLAHLHTKLNHIPEATKIMQDAIHEFAGTPEEVRVTIANAQLAIERSDFDAALAMLRSITSDKPYFIKAKMVLANLYLTHKNDRKAYVATFEELNRNNPNVNTFFLVGDAYMKIQEPEKAISVYENALKQNRNDAALASKIGKALVNTHDYARAIDYYETAVRNDPTKALLRHDLALLYLKLKKFDQAERVLMEALEKSTKDNDDANALISDVKFLMLLARVYRGSYNHQRAIDSLMRARDFQNSVLMRVKGEQHEYVRQQKQVAASICYGLAEYHDEQKNYEKALGFYNEALRHDDGHEKSMLALARLHLARGELDSCQHQCVTLLRMDPSNEEASIMLADLMFRKNEYESATFHFQQLLERKPNHYGALFRLIQLLRRAGKLKDTPRFFKMAENLSQRAQFDAGLHFCKGVYHRYTNNPHEALRELNLARKDGEWGERAVTHMIEIYLNPDNDAMWEEGEGKADNAEAIKAAEKLLKELVTRPKTLHHQILECYALMATKNKANIEKALAKFIDILNTERDHVPALLGMATCYMMLKQTPKARNQLKRIAKMQYNANEADEFERSWLALADVYIQGGKYDLAQELLKRASNNNKSCAKAWEYMGYIMEKEQSYRDAADFYENAWKYENEASATVGYKLAFNYLKAKRYVDAIDVCHKVLAAYPNYPKIKKEILDKARQSLRP